MNKPYNPEVHKLSSQETTLNIDALIEVAQIAMGYAREELNKQVKTVQDCMLQAYMVKDDDEQSWHKRHSAHFHGRYIVEAANDLAKSTDAWFYLTEAKRRENLIIER